MRTYTVYEPPEPPADRIDRAERLEFVRDGFSWPALLFTPLWLLVNFLWLPLIAFLAFAALMGGAIQASLLPEWAAVFVLAVQFVIAFEAGSLKAWRLERKGWRAVGVVNGHSMSDCERRFFDSWLAGEPVLSPAGPVPHAPRASERRRWPLWPGGRQLA